MRISELKMRKAIALCFELNEHFRREIWRGVQEYGVGAKDWVLFCRPRASEIGDWKPEGLISHLSDHKHAEELLAIGIPLVDTASTISDLKLPRVTIDEEAVGAMAAAYLKEKRYGSFAYFSDWKFPTPSGRGTMFQSVIRASGFKLHEPPVRQPDDHLSRKFHPATLRWLHGLPKQTAIFVGSDSVAEWICDLCRLSKIRVPEDIALLSVGNDSIFCLGNYPYLSSIDLPGRKLGFEAAKMLDRLMQGRGSGRLRPVKPFPPIGVVTRHSTDADVSEDSRVVAIKLYIQENISKPFKVGDIVRSVGVCRRLLEIACRTGTDRTLLELIHVSRVEKAKDLLGRTTMKIEAIAAACGFSNSFHLRRIFAKYTGTTPSAHREKLQITTRGG